MVKDILLHLDDDEFELLDDRRGDRTWKEFLVDPLLERIKEEEQAEADEEAKGEEETETEEEVEAEEEAETDEEEWDVRSRMGRCGRT